MNDEIKRFQFIWLTSSPLMPGNWLGLVLGMIPLLLAALAWFFVLGLGQEQQGPIFLSGSLFLSVAAILVQAPAYMGRAELDSEDLVLIGRLFQRLNRRRVPRPVIQDAFFSPLARPPAWVPLVWGLFELLTAAGTLSAAWGHGQAHWAWLSAFVLGLSFWPLMIARQTAKMQVVVLYERPGHERPGVMQAWATPQHAGALVLHLTGKAAPDAEPNLQEITDDPESIPSQSE